MRIQYLFTALALGAVLAAPAGAQSIKKVGDDIHHVLKKAGNTVKEDAGDVGSAAHQTLTKAGNDTKAQLAKTTGVHTVGGDVGKAAQSVSHASKKAGRSAKSQLKKTSSAAHDSL